MGNALKEVRESKGITQKFVASQLVVKNNPIAYLENHGYRWTSDPNLYYQSYNPNRGKKPWGKRDHYEYGINVDSYCGGYHRAYDMVKWHGAGIPAIANATVLRGSGWNTFGYTLVLGFKDAKGRLFQVIYGHLNRNPLLDFRIGQNVKQGQIVAYQGASNNLKRDDELTLAHPIPKLSSVE